MKKVTPQFTPKQLTEDELQVLETVQRVLPKLTAEQVAKFTMFCKGMEAVIDLKVT